MNMLGNLLPVGFEEHEVRVLEALLTLGGRRLNRPWQLSGRVDNSYILAKVDASEASQSRWQELVRELGTESLIALARPELNIPVRWRIQVRDKYVPGLRDLVEILNTLTSHSGQATATPSPPVANAPERFDPSHHFISLVDTACEQGVATYFEYQYLGIYCCPEQRAFFSVKPLEELLPLMQAKPAEVTRKAMYVLPDFEQLKAEGWKRYDLLELRWFATLVASQGRLHKHIDPAEPLYLGTLPNWIRLPYYSEYAAIASFINTAAEPVARIAAATGHADTEVADFINACHALKLLLRGQEAMEVCQAQQAARQRITALCHAFSEQAAKPQLKLVFTGSIGAGKTTAIGQLSEHPIMLTETRPSDDTQYLKGTTTVAMDYGSITCPNGTKIHLYGTPGQRRFEFMGQILAQGATAITIFVGNIENDPLAELKHYIDQYRCFATQARIVVAVTHSDLVASPAPGDYARTLAAEGLDWPVVVADPRNATGLIDLFERLL